MHFLVDIKRTDLENEKKKKNSDHHYNPLFYSKTERNKKCEKYE
jgi:hypothetical protein